MLPPGDSWRHNNLKLAEMIEETNKHKKLAQSRPPPPAYTPTPVSVPRNNTQASAGLITPDPCNPNEQLVSSYDYEVCDCSCGCSNCTGEYEAQPVIIKIEAGTDIQGEGNHVILTDSRKLKQAPFPSSTQSSNNVRPTASDRLIVDTTSTAELIAASVLEALKKEGIIPTNPLELPRPVHLTINAGITIKGNKNVIYSGPPSTGENKQSRPQRIETKEDDGSKEDEENLASGTSRKRKAQSVRNYSSHRFVCEL